MQMAAAAAAVVGTGPMGPVVKVKREVMEACLTCPLCKKLLQAATTICECLHTFCRKCIYDKLTDEELECCPICNIDLGCSPVEKLRPDHNLQDVRAKIFPLKTRKVSAPEVASISLPVRRKERSLSSLVVNTPRVATQSGLTGRRTKAFTRKAAALRGSTSLVDDTVKKEEGNAEEQPESSSSPETTTIKTSQNRRQSTSSAEPSNHLSNKDAEDTAEPFVDKAELWKPLNCLVEAANRTKSLKYNPQGSIAKTEQSNGLENEINIHKPKMREHSNKSKVQDEKNSPTASVSTKSRRLHGTSRKKAAAARELCSSAQALLDAANVRRERGTGPIWLSLITSTNQEGDVALPQISACYLRIKDGNLPASFIQKYLAKKLELSNDTEVDITCRGQQVAPTLELHKLVDLWLQTGSTQKAQATVGTSAKDFVMVLNYSRKVPPS